jgi:hypothetical protein
MGPCHRITGAFLPTIAAFFSRMPAAPILATISLAVATKKTLADPVSSSVPDDAIMTAEAQPSA